MQGYNVTDRKGDQEYWGKAIQGYSRVTRVTRVTGQSAKRRHPHNKRKTACHYIQCNDYSEISIVLIIELITIAVQKIPHDNIQNIWKLWFSPRCQNKSTVGNTADNQKFIYFKINCELLKPKLLLVVTAKVVEFFVFGNGFELILLRYLSCR